MARRRAAGRATDKPIELRVMPLGESDYGVALFQRPVSRSENGADMHQVVRVWGTPFRAIVGEILEALRRGGYRATDLHRRREKPFSLAEEHGVRLGLLLLAVKPLRKTERITAIVDAVGSMSEEEAYYWFSKCTGKDHARRAQKALRILLARE